MIFVEQDSGSLVANIRVIFRTGSLADPSDRAGVANFTGRALLRGTKKRPYKVLTYDIERIGGSLAVTTDQNQTQLLGTVIAKNLEPFLAILGEIITEPAFDAEQMGLLKMILQGELQSWFQDVRVLASRAAMMTAYSGTRMAMPSIGSLDSIEKLTAEDAQKFFKSHYTRQGLLIAMTSPSTADQMKRMLQPLVDAVPSGGISEAKALPAPRVEGRQAVVAEKDGMSTVPLYVAVPGISDADPDAPALELGNFAFGAEFSSRLMQILRAQNGWTYGASSSYFGLVSPKREPTLFSIYTFPSVEYASLALPRAVSLLEEYVEKGITEEEFQASREALINRYPFKADTAGKRLDLKLREILTGRKYLSVDEYRAYMGALSQSKVNELIRRKTSPDRMVISAAGDPALLKPILEKIPAVRQVEVLLVEP
jgi:zinc protease